MNPIYKFELQIVTNSGTAARTANPIWPSDLAKEISRDSNEQFYRSTLSGKLTFIHGDYDFIMSETIDTRFGLLIYISYDNGINYQEYWHGKFFLTDCEINIDAKTCVVAPSVDDGYDDMTSGLEKEFNLLDLAPVVKRIKIDKRPVIQIYSPGEPTIGCFLAGMWWEQECEPVYSYTNIRSKYFFAESYNRRILKLSGSTQPVLPTEIFGTATYPEDANWEIRDGNYLYRYKYEHQSHNYAIGINRLSDGLLLWAYEAYSAERLFPPYTVTLTPRQSWVHGNVTLEVIDRMVFSRLVCDKESIPGATTHRLPDDDLVSDNYNYHYCATYQFTGAIAFYNGLSEEPTKWGRNQKGLYFEQPPEGVVAYGKSYPICRSQWEDVSVWFLYEKLDPTYNILIEPKCRTEFTLRDAYPLWSVISVLLKETMPEVQHKGLPEYSQFLYGQAEIGLDYMLYITPKSNILVSEYDEPAKQAPITLKQVLDMLRNCFRCFWFIDTDSQGNKRFRIEHVSYFNSGRSYASAQVGMDITQLLSTRNGKPLSYGTNLYTYNKPEMAGRYEFEWADDTTELFKGYPIEVRNKYVNKSNIETVSINGFTSDIDLMLLSPGAFSNDGFALLAGKAQNELSEPVPSTIYYGGSESIFAHTREDEQTVKLWGQEVTIKIYADRPATLVQSEVDERLHLIRSEVITHLNAGLNIITFRAYLVNEYALVIGVIDGTPNTNIVVQEIGALAKIPYLTYKTYNVLQNGQLAFCNLVRYYMFDMPAPQVFINGEQQAVVGTKRARLQTLNIPMREDPDVYKLIHTELGNGMVQKASINLSSRNAKITLEHSNE